MSGANRWKKSARQVWGIVVDLEVAVLSREEAAPEDPAGLGEGHLVAAHFSAPLGMQMQLENLKTKRQRRKKKWLCPSMASHKM